MIEKKALTQYLNNFRIQFSKYLKINVGVQTISYPFDKGVIIIAVLGFGIQTKDEFRKDSTNFKEALNKTNLFDGDINIPQEIPNTFIILIKNKIILIKPDKEKQWSNKSVEIDVKSIVKSILEKRNQQNWREN